MLYMVECRFTDRARENAWSEWYNDRLDILVALPGFRTAQRFRAMAPGAAPYFAIHSIDSAEVFTSEEYRLAHGGGFQEWQPYITDWKRRLFTGIDVAPAIELDEYLIVADGRWPDAGATGIRFIWLASARPEDSVTERGIAKASAGQVRELTAGGDCPFAIYIPITRQKRRCAIAP